MEELSKCRGFQWDAGNADKNWIAHKVTRTECEQIFFNRPLITAHGKDHVEHELRYYALGQTDSGRVLFVVFTIRDELVRVISARDMSRRERRIYAHGKKEE